MDHVTPEQEPREAAARAFLAAAALEDAPPDDTLEEAEHLAALRAAVASLDSGSLDSVEAVDATEEDENGETWVAVRVAPGEGPGAVQQVAVTSHTVYSVRCVVCDEVLAGPTADCPEALAVAAVRAGARFLPESGFFMGGMACPSCVRAHLALAESLAARGPLL